MREWLTRPRFSILTAVIYLALLAVVQATLSALTDEYGWWPLG